jgi:hypothetical protein
MPHVKRANRSDPEISLNAQFTDEPIAHDQRGRIPDICKDLAGRGWPKCHFIFKVPAARNSKNINNPCG